MKTQEWSIETLGREGDQAFYSVKPNKNSKQDMIITLYKKVITIFSGNVDISEPRNLYLNHYLTTKQ